MKIEIPVEVNLVEETDEGFSVTAPSGGEVKTFDPNTADLATALDFIATLVTVLKSKKVI